LTIEHDSLMENFNVRGLLLEDATLRNKWLPAITAEYTSRSR